MLQKGGIWGTAMGIVPKSLELCGRLALLFTGPNNLHPRRQREEEMKSAGRTNKCLLNRKIEKDVVKRNSLSTSGRVVKKKRENQQTGQDEGTVHEGHKRIVPGSKVCPGGLEGESDAGEPERVSLDRRGGNERS